MATITAPLLSFSASGQIAKTQVYSRWKGRPYVRRYVIPSNPQSVDQTQTRSVFSWLNAVWRYYPEPARAAWEAYAKARQFMDRNAWIKQNLPSLREAMDIDNIIISPSALSGLAAAGVTVTAAAGKATVVMTPPSLPIGWTILAAHAAAIPQQDPHTGVKYEVLYGTDTVPPYSFDVTGMTPGQEYVIGAWFSYLREDLTTAYGVSIQGPVTPL